MISTRRVSLSSLGQRSPVRASCSVRTSAPARSATAQARKGTRFNPKTRSIEITKRSFSDASPKSSGSTLTPDQGPIQGALKGVRVLDLSRVLAGPFCTMVLGDYGAEVVKVESRLGDDTRTWGPPFAGGESAYFMAVNRNKKSIVVDFKKEEGIKILHDLVPHFDVFVENFIPGKLDQIGLGYETLSKINSGLVYCSITGFGPDGPYSQRPGYDVVASAIGGLISITGEEDRPPVKTGVALTDLSTGLFAHGAVLAALHAKKTTGRGQHINCSLLESQVATLVNIASSFLIGGIEPKRRGTAHESIVPYQSFPTSDGFIVVGAGNNAQFSRLCSAIGQPRLPLDPRFASNAARVEHRKELLPLLEQVFRTKTTKEWSDLLQTLSLPNGPINSMQQVFSDPQVIHRRMVEEIEHPTAGKVKLAGIPVKFSDTQASIRLPPPLLGQHTDEILSTFLGYDKEQLAQLRKNGVI